MKSMSKWLVAALAVVIVALAASGGAALRAQQAQGKPAMTKEEKAKAQAERIAMFKKTFPNAKISLAAALATGEKEGKGRAHSVEYTLTKEGKLTIEVGLLVGDKFGAVYVDPDSGKASAVKMQGAGGEEDEEGEEEEEDEGEEVSVRP